MKGEWLREVRQLPPRLLPIIDMRLQGGSFMRRIFAVIAGAIILAIFLSCWSFMPDSSDLERYCEDGSDSYEPTEFA